MIAYVLLRDQSTPPAPCLQTRARLPMFTLSVTAENVRYLAVPKPVNVGEQDARIGGGRPICLRDFPLGEPCISHET